MTPIAELRGISKVYEMETVRVHALRGVSLTLAAGEFTAIMGASGSGKSTLLNVLGCLDQPSGGTYLLEGERVDRFGEERLAECRRTRVGFVFQSFNLLSRSTSLENVELPMVYQGIGRQERLERARQALAMVGLADRMNHSPPQLSGGQQQRVALARALVTRPRLLLADEPTGNLDSKTAEEVLDLLVRLQDKEQITMAIVTHNPDVAACAHRIVVLHDGLVVHDQISPSRGGPPIPHIRTVAGRTGVQADTPPSGPPAGP